MALNNSVQPGFQVEPYLPNQRTFRPVEGQPVADGPLTEPPPAATRPGYGPDYVPDPNLPQYGYQTGVGGKENYNVDIGFSEGLMDTVNGIGNSKYADRGYGIAPGRATTREVAREELSQYQLEQMLASDSPLMRQRAAAGLAAAGGRGLMNSSAAIGASQGAMITGAQPFALQDAGWYGQTAADNMNAVNTMEGANLNARGLSMQAESARDRQILQDQLSGYGDIRKAMINIENREDTQANTAWQNQLNRDWTTNENMLTNSLAWAQSRLDVAKSLGVTREQAFAEMYSSIMNNPNPKFTASQREQAVRNMKATMDERYAGEPVGAFEASFNPKTGEYDESLRPSGFSTDSAPAPAAIVGGDPGERAYFDPAAPWKSYPDAQVYGSQISSEVGRTTARLPAV